MTDSKSKRAIAFIDGQNLFHAAKNAFGYRQLGRTGVVTYSRPLRYRNPDWIPLDRAAYERCVDPRDYRPKGTR